MFLLSLCGDRALALVRADKQIGEAQQTGRKPSDYKSSGARMTDRPSHSAACRPARQRSETSRGRSRRVRETDVMTMITLPTTSMPGQRPQESGGRLVNCFAESLGESA